MSPQTTTLVFPIYIWGVSTLCRTAVRAAAPTTRAVCWTIWHWSSSTRRWFCAPVYETAFLKGPFKNPLQNYFDEEESLTRTYYTNGSDDAKHFNLMTKSLFDDSLELMSHIDWAIKQFLFHCCSFADYVVQNIKLLLLSVDAMQGCKEVPDRHFCHMHSARWKLSRTLDEVSRHLWQRTCISAMNKTKVFYWSCWHCGRPAWIIVFHRSATEGS